MSTIKKCFPVIRQEFEKRKAPPLRRNIDYTSIARKTLCLDNIEKESDMKSNYGYENNFGFDNSHIVEEPPLKSSLEYKNIAKTAYSQSFFDTKYLEDTNRKFNYYYSLYKKHYKVMENPSCIELLDFLYDKSSLEREKNSTVAKYEPDIYDTYIKSKTHKTAYPFTDSVYLEQEELLKSLDDLQLTDDTADVVEMRKDIEPTEVENEARNSLLESVQEHEVPLSFRKEGDTPPPRTKHSRFAREPSYSELQSIVKKVLESFVDNRACFTSYLITKIIKEQNLALKINPSFVKEMINSIDDNSDLLYGYSTKYIEIINDNTNKKTECYLYYPIKDEKGCLKLDPGCHITDYLENKTDYSILDNAIDNLLDEKVSLTDLFDFQQLKYCLLDKLDEIKAYIKENLGAK